ncbi:hypothetical protein DYB26_000923 [Aphanomyces astaci]|uniref:WH2 domain-containing protein n=1 Tax=Aphanomyces astaci TaxID=112090 RepID=A0A3R7AM59_APHAT|nr:hypothetical protein DYB26_000923 [Aphanomyces astaci]
MLPVHTADISTPTPGSPTQDGIAVDTVPFCICISTSSGVAYLNVHDDASKKAWSAVLLRISQYGPQDAIFSKQDMASTADFVFSARVSAYRVIDGKAYICNKKANKGHLRGPEGVTDDPQGTGQTSRCHDDVSKAPPAPSSSCPPPNRGNLLAQIHQGTKLKCVVQT